MQAKEPGKSIAILQSNYIPWKGYFDIIGSVDEFLIFDDVQYTRRDWRNRNRIVQNGKLLWLTIPVAAKGAFEAPINAMRINDRSWARKHWASIRHAYAKTAHFGDIAPELEPAYARAADLGLLTEVNELLLRTLSGMLGLAPTFQRTEQIPRRADDATGRLVEICLARGARTYLSGPAAKAYIDQAQFDAAGITVAYANYSGYPAYEQGMQPFEHGVSMLDVLFRFGRAACFHLKTTSDRSAFLDIVR